MKHSLKFFLLFAIMIAPVFAFATPAGGGSAAPIDGGLSLLVAAGVGYGAKKIAARKKNAEENQK